MYFSLSIYIHIHMYIYIYTYIYIPCILIVIVIVIVLHIHIYIYIHILKAVGALVPVLPLYGQEFGLSQSSVGQRYNNNYTLPEPAQSRGVELNETIIS